MRKITTSPTTGISANQRTLATQLGIATSHIVTVSDLVAQIEEKLGDRLALESARWFVMSVLRHVEQAQWTEPEQSNITREQQYELARKAMAIPEFSASIKTVLKGDSCRYSLVEFKRSRNTAKRILSNTTAAYRIAAQLVAARQAEESGMQSDASTDPEAATEQPVPEVPTRNAEPQSADTVTSGNASSDATPQPTTANLRRASRRGFAGESVDSPPSTVAGSHDVKPMPSLRMSPQEYAELEKVITQPVVRSGLQQTWLRFGSDESRSWLLGLLAGLFVFGVALWLFL